MKELMLFEKNEQAVVSSRVIAPFKTISTIAFLEDMVSNTIWEEMAKGTYYKEIYKKCKANGEQIMQFAYLPKLTA